MNENKAQIAIQKAQQLRYHSFAAFYALAMYDLSFIEDETDISHSRFQFPDAMNRECPENQD